MRICRYENSMATARPYLVRTFCTARAIELMNCFRWGAWWRRLLPVEEAFVRKHFGAVVGDKLIARVRLGIRRVGDTRRALCLNGGRLSMPRQCFVQAAGFSPLLLTNPLIAGIFAHELLHELQRMQGMAVTRQALVLQCRWLFFRANPYSYSCLGNSRALLRQFWRANVEQQGQMWQDCVQAQVAGKPLSSHALLPLAVKSARLRTIVRPSS